MANSIPTEFAQVTAATKAKVFFDGKVVSHALTFEDGSRKSLGLIYPGDFHFGTDLPEKMEIVAGRCKVQLDGSSEWTTYEAGTFFTVPGKSGFSIQVAEGITEYICSFG